MKKIKIFLIVLLLSIFAPYGSKADDVCTGKNIAIKWEQKLNGTVVVDAYINNQKSTDYSYVWQVNYKTISPAGFEWTNEGIQPAISVKSGDVISVFATKVIAQGVYYTLSTNAKVDLAHFSGESILTDSKCSLVGESSTGTSSSGQSTPTAGSGIAKPEPTAAKSTSPAASPSQAAPAAVSANDKPGALNNPLPVDNVTDALLLIMKGFLGIIGIWAVTFVLIGGFRMIMAQGDEEALKRAKSTITWAVLGLIIATLSFAIIAIIQNFLGIKT